MWSPEPLGVARDRSNEVVESGDTKGINLISMKPFLLTIVGPFQSSNPPYFKAGFVIKLLGCFFSFSFFFPKLMVFSKDFYCCYNLWAD